MEGLRGCVLNVAKEQRQATGQDRRLWSERSVIKVYDFRGLTVSLNVESKMWSSGRTMQAEDR